MDGDDPFGATQTAGGAPPSAPTSGGYFATGTRFGRYVIERELGAGGMGIVYAAFDQELERKVAIKLLRAGRSDDARRRLLREARAMARLAHPNIVSVFDVGTIEGRDYVAMELIDGTNLAEWLRAEKRAPKDVLAHFLAAGAGLAAAHDAGVVHRDFKPHNVLVGKNGRVAVTDFGLAREVSEIEDVAELSAMPATPSPLSGLTVPGTIMGTPAYMAPEQWDGGEVSPATDQFAFCVALWEGLAGRRPFAGDTDEELRNAVHVGRTAAGDIPIRKVRAALVRGLTPEPAKRWPSLAALLAAITPRRKPWIALAGVVGVVIVAIAFGGRSTPAATCTPPARDPAAVWGLPEQIVIRAASADAAAKIDDAIAAWQRTRATACTTEPEVRPARLLCLDKVLARIDALRRTREYDLHMSSWGLVAQSFPAEVCLQPDPPRMPAAYAEPAVIALAMRSGAKLGPEAVARMKAAADTDPCARSYAAYSDNSPLAAEVARDAAVLCADDQAFATSTMNMLSRRLDAYADPGTPEAMRDLERAMAHAAQPFLASQYASFRAHRALYFDQLDAAIAWSGKARSDALPEFERDHRWSEAQLTLDRGTREDDVTSLRDSEWLANRPEMRDLAARIAATVGWWRGEHAPALGADDPRLEGPHVAGRVIDEQGQPVAGARVASGEGIRADRQDVSLAILTLDATTVTHATTDSEGRFSILAAGHWLVATDGPRRSAAIAITSASDTPTLVLHRTRAIRGAVAAVPPRGRTWVAPIPAEPHLDLRAPVTDGAFALTIPAATRGVQLVHAELVARSFGPMVALGDPIALPALGRRSFVVVVRGVAIQGGAITAVAGKLDVASAGELDRRAAGLAGATNELLPVSPDDTPGLPKEARRGDLAGTLAFLPDGDITVCARAYHIDPNDPTFLDRYNAKVADQPVRCTLVAPDATTVVIEAPAMGPVAP